MSESDDNLTPSELVSDENRFASKTKGIAKYADYPYKGYEDTCLVDEKETVAVVLQALVYHEEGVDEKGLKYLIYNRGPIIIGMQAGMGFFDYGSGIAVAQDFDCYPEMDLSHAVLFVGYGTEGGTDFWIVKNSYSPDWGERGFFRMKRNSNTCKLKEYIVGVEIQGPSRTCPENTTESSTPTACPENPTESPPPKNHVNSESDADSDFYDFSYDDDSVSSIQSDA